MKLLDAALREIQRKLSVVMWNKNQEEYESPFMNTGGRFKCNVFEVQAYDWNNEADQPFNFKWKEIEVKWYKYLGRGMECNIQITPDQINEMLNECIDFLEDWDNENFIEKTFAENPIE